MKKVTTKIIAGIAAATMVMGLCACGNGGAKTAEDQIKEGVENLVDDLQKELNEAVDEITDAVDEIKEEVPTTGMVNPMTEMTEEELTSATSVDLPVPEGATDAHWFKYDLGNGNVLAEVQFVYEGYSITYRGQMTDVTNIADAEDISGMYLADNATRVETTVSGRNAYVNTDDSMGYVEFLDVVPGVLYCLDVASPVSADELVYLAEKTFVCMQGED